MKRSLVALCAVGPALAVVASCGGRVAPTPTASVPNLTYTKTVHYQGLDEDVLVVKNPNRVYAQRADGTIESVPSLVAEDRAAWANRFGLLSPSLAAELETAPPNVPIPIAALVDVSLNCDDLQERLMSPNPRERRRAQDELREKAKLATQPVEFLFRSSGMTSVDAPASILPVVFGDALPATIARLGRFGPGAGISTIVANPTLPAIPTGVPQGPPGTTVTSPVTFPAIDTGFNDMNYFGEGQSIGMIENAGCGILDEHEAFQFSTVQYQTFPITCSSDADCTAACDGSFLPLQSLFGRCYEGYCVSAHVTEQASVISASQDGQPHGAALATLVFPNMGAPGTSAGGVKENLVACSAQGMLNAFNYLQEQEVTTANESFDCDPSSMGVTEDYFVRYADMSVFHASGNSAFAQTLASYDANSPDPGACSQDPNGICVGGVNPQRTMSCFSVWANPFEQGSTTVRSDREEPDIVALAGDTEPPTLSNGCGAATELVQTIGVPGYSGWPPAQTIGLTDWSGDVGTSFASPAMASVAALMKEACGQSLNHLLMRAILRTAGWSLNAADYPYSTPGPNEDWKDGGGGPFATTVLPFCGYDMGPGQPTTATGNVNVSLNSGSTLPVGSSPPAGSAPPGECVLASCAGTQAVSEGVTPQSYTPPGPNDGRVGGTFIQNLYLNVGDRIRVTFSWDACPIGTTGTAPDAVSTDIDIFLYSVDNAAYLYGSQSIADDNEGFDVIVPPEWAGSFNVYYGVIPTTGCNGATSEPSAWAAAWGQF